MSRDDLLRAHLSALAGYPAGSSALTAAVVDLIEAYQQWPLLAVRDELEKVRRIVNDRIERRRMMGVLIEALEELAVAEAADRDDVIAAALEAIRETSPVLERAREARAKRAA